MGETTDNINEVISTGGNFALLAEVIEFLKKKRKKVLFIRHYQHLHLY